MISAAELVDSGDVDEVGSLFASFLFCFSFLLASANHSVASATTHSLFFSLLSFLVITGDVDEVGGFQVCLFLLIRL
jgi:hypothetical protein